VSTGRLTRQQFVGVTSTSAARALGLFPKKGVVAPGADADLVLWDGQLRRPIRAERFASNSDYSPYEGWPVTGWPRLTISRGEIIARDGVVEAQRGRGAVPRRERIDTLRPV
jgi:dihydropyrimidinase